MAVAVDASTPAIVTSTGTAAVTTASFNPPACVLVACMNADPDRTYTMSNNGAALTWTKIAERTGAGSTYGASPTAYYAILTASRTGMTVTATGSVSGYHAFKLYVLTGADMVDPVGAGTNGSSASNTLTTTAFTTEAAASMGFVVGANFDATSANTTSSDVTFFKYDVADQISGGSGYKTLGAAASSATFTVDAQGTGSMEWDWISFEIKLSTAVAFRSASTTGNAASSSTFNCPVPSGAAVNDIAVSFVETWSGDVTITPPSGFTQKGTSGPSGCTFSSNGNVARNYVFWKRLTGADAGNYTWTFNTGKWATVETMLFTGCVTSGDPWDVVVSTAGVIGLFGSVTAMSLTLTDGNGVQVFTVYNDTAGTHTPPTGFTEPAAMDVDCASCAYRLNTGTTGAVTVSGASISTTDPAGAWTGALKAGGGAAPPVIVEEARNQSAMALFEGVGYA